MIPEDKIAEIKQAARISEFISPYVDLKRAGRDRFKGLCPFHGEKTPSFSVSDDGGFYHCFGCGVGGNVFKFLMGIENLTFPEAVARVAERVGIEVPQSGGGGGGRSRSELTEVAVSAARYFRACLMETPPGRVVAEYLGERGVSDTASEQFLIGAAPVSGDGLVRWFRREGVDLGDAERLGMVGRRGDRVYDKFRGRLMFPIRDAQGRIVGFGGRAIGETDGPKYLNTPDSDIYHKSRVLYGLWEAREARREARDNAERPALVLVEGYLDVIAMHQAGLTDAVATCGTALTVEQARLMKRHGDGAIALFDGDKAGRAAAARSFAVFLEAGVWPTGATLPDGEDPDSLIVAQGADALRRILEAAAPLAEAYVRHAAESAGDTDVARLGSDIARLLAKVRDPFERDYLLKKASLWTGISEKLLTAESGARQAAERRAARSAPADRESPGPPMAPPPLDEYGRSEPEAESEPSRYTQPVRGGAPGPEELLVTVFVSDIDGIARVADDAIVDVLEEEPWASIARDFVADHAEGDRLDAGEMLSRMPEQARARVAARLLDDMFTDHNVRERVLKDCVAKLARTANRKRNREALARVRRKEELGEEVLDELDGTIGTAGVRTTRSTDV